MSLRNGFYIVTSCFIGILGNFEHYTSHITHHTTIADLVMIPSLHNHLLVCIDILTCVCCTKRRLISTQTHMLGSSGDIKYSHFSSTRESLVNVRFLLYVVKVFKLGSTTDSSTIKAVLAPPSI